MSEVAIEQEINNKGLNAPRIKPDMITDVIMDTDYRVFPGTTLTICCLTLRNGFTVTGESACASLENFDQEIGRKIAFDNARQKIWQLEGYLLRQKIYEHGLAEDDAPYVVAIAKVAHEVNRAYCSALGDNSQPEWKAAPDWQRSSAITGVEFHIANPNAGPDHSHNAWLEEKTADGWKYGAVKDAEKKEHPCCVSYEELPIEQKAKDFLFRGVVHAMKD